MEIANTDACRKTNLGNQLYNSIEKIVWINMHKPVQTKLYNNNENPDINKIIDNYVWENIVSIKNQTMSAI